MPRLDTKKLLESWRTIANFVYTADANEANLKALLEAELAKDKPRASVLTLIYQRYSTFRRERELEDIFKKVVGV